MISKEKIFSALFLQLSCVILTLSTGIFGGAPLLLLRRTADTLNFIFLQLLTITIALYFKAQMLALMILCTSILILVFVAMEKKNILLKSVVAVLSSTAAFFFILFLWVHFKEGAQFWGWISTQVEFYFIQAKTVIGEMSITLETLTHQVPSLIVTLLALNLWIAVLFDSRAQRRMGTLRAQIEIKNFRTPDVFIWVIIVSLLFSFLKTPVPGLQEAALNVLNVSLLLYFFQGLSVLSFLMENLNFGSLLKMIVYFIFIAQLLLPICLGILDFWLNFRNKISKKAL
ncbi:MAG: DUF2232 domain-containing protein [Bdellovibrionota bacterium]